MFLDDTIYNDGLTTHVHPIPELTLYEECKGPSDTTNIGYLEECFTRGLPTCSNSIF